MKLLSPGHSAIRWQGWASNLSLTPRCSLFAKTGVTGFLTHVYVRRRVGQRDTGERKEHGLREFCEVQLCSAHGVA